MIKTKNRRAVTSIGIVAIAALMIVSVGAYDYAEAKKHNDGGGGGDGGGPANKTVIGEPVVEVVVDKDNWKTIIKGEIKTSTNSDLHITHFQECAIHTGLKLDAQRQDLTSVVREDVRLIIDGKIIPAAFGDKITHPPGNDDKDGEGVVTMCGRAYAIETNVLSNIDALCTLQGEQCLLDPSFFDSYIRTKQTHGWQWIALNVGADNESTEHTVKIQARTFDTLAGMKMGSSDAKNVASDSESCMKDLDPELEERGCVDSILEVGKRVLIIEEDKLAVGAHLGIVE